MTGRIQLFLKKFVQTALAHVESTRQILHADFFQKMLIQIADDLIGLIGFNLNKFVGMIVVLSLFSWASVARITRAETMSLKERDFVVATQNLGASNFRVIIKHIIPNILGPVIVAASLSVANAILMESSLSFLGLGVQIPRASWGSMLQGAQAHILDYPLLAVYPGVMILITVLSFNLLGDILRNALEPKIVE